MLHHQHAFTVLPFVLPCAFMFETKPSPVSRQRSLSFRSPVSAIVGSTMTPSPASSFRLKSKPLARLHSTKTRNTTVFFLKSGPVAFTSISFYDTLFEELVASHRVPDFILPTPTSVRPIRGCGAPPSPRLPGPPPASPSEPTCSPSLVVPNRP